MTAFAIIAAVMLTVACAFVLFPLLSRRRMTPIEREASNLSVLRDQRTELENDLALGVLSAEQYESARLELDRRVLEETRTAQRDPASPAPTARWTAAVIGASLPIAAVLLYLVLGTPAVLLFQPPSTQATLRDGSKAPSAQQIETMIEEVKVRLAKEPGNLEGWTVLARTYYALGRGEEAATAFERATALSPNDADLLADYADALGIAQGRSLDGKPAEIIARALRANPNQWKANALAGTLAFQRHEFAKAVEHWERVKASVPPDSPVARSLEPSLAEARLAARGPAANANAQAVAQGSPSVAAAPGARNVAGTVSLAPALAAGVAPDDTVFVYARPTDGSRMPLALLRAKARDLPLAFSLDDGTAMLPSRKLSDHGEVIVGARVSKSGNATPQPGDLETTTAPVKLGASGLKLVIDRRLP